MSATTYNLFKPCWTPQGMLYGPDWDGPKDVIVHMDGDNTVAVAEDDGTTYTFAHHPDEVTCPRCGLRHAP